MAERYISVGKLGKPHGVRGAFRFLLHRELKSKKKLPTYFIIGGAGNAAPRFIVSIEWVNWNDGFISFEDITSVEQAKSFSGGELYVLDKDEPVYFKKDTGTARQLIGFHATDKQTGDIGTVADVMETPGQTLLVIEGKNVLIPFVDEFILKINMRSKEIKFDLPEGLLDL